ncbi:MAG: inhibitor of cysteine peptidase [Solirubrobacteraceae bacterium]|jgi:predicted secreted protein|nr:inhibitor of cysteine peptidase [Solirubrobacteraceae bacterium]
MADIEVRGHTPRVSVTQGDRITVRLDENPSTGYQWSAAPTSDILEVASSELLPGPTTSPGAGGARVIVLRSARAGLGQVHFSLARSWQREKPIDGWTLDVDVGA